MSKATQLSKNLEPLGMEAGMKLIEKAGKKALQSAVIEDAMCIMHDDGSVNIIAGLGNGIITSEVISAANILKVLQHYRPFKEVFKANIQ